MDYPMHLWKALNSSFQFTITADYIHDFLLIIFGSITFDVGDAAMFLSDHLAKYGYSRKQSKSEMIIKESREYFKDRIAYIPIGHFKESKLHNLHPEPEKYLLKPEIQPLKSNLYKSKRNLSEKPNKYQKEEDSLILTSRSPKDWSFQKEKSLTERLSKTRSVKFKIDVEDLKVKEIEECSHRPEICPLPSFLKVKPELPPKSFNSTVSRIRKKRIEDNKIKEDDKNYLAKSGERLEKVRRRKFEPPSLLNRPKKTKKVALNIDITVYPGK